MCGGAFSEVRVTEGSGGGVGICIVPNNGLAIVGEGNGSQRRRYRRTPCT